MGMWKHCRGIFWTIRINDIAVICSICENIYSKLCCLYEGCRWVAIRLEEERGAANTVQVPLMVIGQHIHLVWDTSSCPLTNAKRQVTLGYDRLDKVGRSTILGDFESWWESFLENLTISLEVIQLSVFTQRSHTLPTHWDMVNMGPSWIFSFCNKDFHY